MLKFIIKKPYIPWFCAITAYLFFIMSFSALYPLGGDEYFFMPKTLGDIISNYFTSYLSITPRIGLILNNTILFFGKWFFCLINPLIQLTLNLLLFFAVFLRCPNFKTLKDLFHFSLILILTSFACAQPDNTLFWIGGVSNYSFSIIPFLFFLILIRFFLIGKNEIINRIPHISILSFVLFFILGMSSEVLGPMSFILLVYLFLYCKMTSILPAWWKYALFGIITGITIFFLAPGSYARLNTPIYAYFRKLPLYIKILNHIPIMLKAYLQQWCLFPLSIFILLFCAAKHKTLSNKDFNFAIIMIISSLLCASALAFAPLKNQRPFYQSSILSIIAFMTSLKILADIYGRYIFRFTFYTAFIFCAVIFPLFAIPFFDLHYKDTQRQQILQKAQKRNIDTVYITPFNSVKGPYDNLTIYFYDLPSNLKKVYNIEIYSTENRPKDQLHIRQY